MQVCQVQGHQEPAEFQPSPKPQQPCPRRFERPGHPPHSAAPHPGGAKFAMGSKDSDAGRQHLKVNWGILFFLIFSLVFAVWQGCKYATPYYDFTSECTYFVHATWVIWIFWWPQLSLVRMAFNRPGQPQGLKSMSCTMPPAPALSPAVAPSPSGKSTVYQFGEQDW